MRIEHKLKINVESSMSRFVYWKVCIFANSNSLWIFGKKDEIFCFAQNVQPVSLRNIDLEKISECKFWDKMALNLAFPLQM